MKIQLGPKMGRINRINRLERIGNAHTKMQRIKISVEDGLFLELQQEAKERGITLSSVTLEYFLEGFRAKKERNSTYRFVRNQLYFDCLNVGINKQILKSICDKSDYDLLMKDIRNEAKEQWEENQKIIESKE